MRMRRPRGLGLALVLAAATACGDRSDPSGPDGPPPLFHRYVALGNSVTAGFESAGLNDSTQAVAYPVQLAARFGAPFSFVRMRQPGCPPPLVGPAPLTTERVGREGAMSCAGFELPPGGLVQNLGLPGIRIAEALSVPAGPVGLVYTAIFGSRPPIDVVVDAEPTLVSVWLGNNDVLYAALSVEPALLTPLDAFETSLDAIVDALAGEGSIQDVILIGVPDPQHVPLLQPGAFFWAAARHPGAAPVVTKPVSDDCAPTLPGGAPNPWAEHLVSMRVLEAGDVAEISCEPGARFVLDPARRATITQRAAAYSAAIAARAAERGWLYVNVDALLEPHLADPERVRRCQALLQATTEDALFAAFEATCPHPDAPDFFGAFFSYDGFHPSAEAQAVFADTLADALAGRHGLAPGPAAVASRHP